MKLIASSRVFLIWAIRKIQNEHRTTLAKDENLQRYNCQIIEELKSEVMANIKDENQ